MPRKLRELWRWARTRPVAVSVWALFAIGGGFLFAQVISAILQPINDFFVSIFGGWLPAAVSYVTAHLIAAVVTGGAGIALYLIAHHNGGKDALASASPAAAIRKPNLVCEITSIFYGGEFEGEGAEQMGGRAALVLFLNVRNAGAPTAALNWHVTITDQGVEYTADKIYMEEVRMRRSKEERPIVIKKDDQMDTVTAKPIPEGGLAQGHLFLVVDRAALASQRGVIRVTFDDVHGESYFATRVIGEGPDTLSWRPGMHLP